MYYLCVCEYELVHTTARSAEAKGRSVFRNTLSLLRRQLSTVSAICVLQDSWPWVQAILLCLHLSPAQGCWDYKGAPQHRFSVFNVSLKDQTEVPSFT